MLYLNQSSTASSSTFFNTLLSGMLFSIYNKQNISFYIYLIFHMCLLIHLYLPITLSISACVWSNWGIRKRVRGVKLIGLLHQHQFRSSYAPFLFPYLSHLKLPPPLSLPPLPPTVIIYTLPNTLVRGREGGGSGRGRWGEVFGGVWAANMKCIQCKQFTFLRFYARKGDTKQMDGGQRGVGWMDG